MFRHLMTSKLSYVLIDCEAFNYLLALEPVRGAFSIPSNIYMDFFVKIVNNANLTNLRGSS